MTPRNLNETLSLIVRKASDLLMSDAASLYIRQSDEEISFEVAINNSLVIDFQRQSMGTGGRGLAAFVFKTGTPLRIANVDLIPSDAPYSFDNSIDKKIGYKTRSVLMEPLKSSKGEVLGVLQLINRKHAKEQKWRSNDLEHQAKMPEFTEDDSKLLQSFAAVASAALENARLYKDIENLFEGFVKASVSAIEARDLSTRGHSERVAALTVDLAERVSGSNDFDVATIRYSESQIAEIRYAALLHDFGKIGVREEVLLKEEKLNPLQKMQIRARFEDFKRSTEIRVLREYLSQLTRENRAPNALEWLRLEKQIQEFGLEIDSHWDLILDVNQPTVLDKDKSSKLETLTHVHCNDCKGQRHPLLKPDEVFSLNVKRGSLTEEERSEIEAHVLFTFEFLKRIPWTRELSKVPEIAVAHHERMTGRGYPFGIKGENIPNQARIMAICDIFDALVANDRPYKPALPNERALEILEMQAKAGDLDSRFLKIFIEAKVYENPLFLSHQGPTKKAA